MCYTIGKCCLIISFIKDIVDDLSDWNDAVSEQNHQELKARYGNTVHMYSNVKELSKNVAIAPKICLKKVILFSQV